MDNVLIMQDGDAAEGLQKNFLYDMDRQVSLSNIQEMIGNIFEDED